MANVRVPRRVGVCIFIAQVGRKSRMIWHSCLSFSNAYSLICATFLLHLPPGLPLDLSFNAFS